mgnify:CR=1 FL=1
MTHSSPRERNKKYLYNYRDSEGFDKKSTIMAYNMWDAQHQLDEMGIRPGAVTREKNCFNNEKRIRDAQKRNESIIGWLIASPIFIALCFGFLWLLDEFDNAKSKNENRTCNYADCGSSRGYYKKQIILFPPNYAYVCKACERQR